MDQHLPSLTDFPDRSPTWALGSLLVVILAAVLAAGCSTLRQEPGKVDPKLAANLINVENMDRALVFGKDGRLVAVLNSEGETLPTCSADPHAENPCSIYRPDGVTVTNIRSTTRTTVEYGFNPQCYLTCEYNWFGRTCWYEPPGCAP